MNVQRDGILTVERDRWVIEPNAPANASGNQWYSLCVELPATDQPTPVLVRWLPLRSRAFGDYGSNHAFDEVLADVLYVSEDGDAWRRIEVTSQAAEGVRFTLEPGRAGRRLAVGMPVDETAVESMLEAGRAHPHARVERIGCALRGAPLHAITVGEPAGAEGVFVISAYQHFSEWAGIRAAGGLLAYLLSPDAKVLRSRWAWVVYPCINVDALRDGWTSDRLSTEGMNLNRDWDDFAAPETRAVRDHLMSIAAKGARLRHGLDLHMGWHSRETCGAGLTVFTDEATPAEVVGAQRRFAETLMGMADYTDFIWESGSLARPNFAAWFTRTFGAVGQTLEISRHRWLDRESGRWMRPSRELETALGVSIARALVAFYAGDGRESD